MKVRLVHGTSTAEIETLPGTTLAQAIWLSGRVAPQPLCSGLGRCGRCRVRFADSPPSPLPAEEEILSAQDLSRGWRLACRRQISDDASESPLFELPYAEPGSLDAVAPSAGPFAGETAKTAPLLLAVDVGTTSVQWRAFEAAGRYPGKTAAEGNFLNPQAGAGSDVMSRLAFAANPAGRRLLSSLLRSALQGVIARLADEGGRVKRVCLAANTAMTDIFLDRDVSGLAASPYHTSHDGHETVTLPGLPPVYIPPLPAPFVGGDAAAALLALLRARIPRPFVLADLGTNAELVLVTGRGKIFMTSVPLGPALEGIGMECGCLAGPDAATDFTLTADGITPRTPGGGRPHGISATGYIALLALLRRLALLDDDGHFAGPETCAMPLTRKVAKNLTRERGRLRLPLAGGLWLSAADVEELLKVRAAFALALERLLATGRTAGRELTRICLAGALGEHVSIDAMRALGFVPPGPEALAVGNAALEGAALLALEPEKGAALAALCRKARLVSLARDETFQREYFERIGFGQAGAGV